MIGLLNILVVEDNEDVREVLAVLLECEGHHVVQAANGQLGLDALAAGPRFGVIILDLMMPVMDGATFLEHKSRGAHADVPVVVFSCSQLNGLERYGLILVRKIDGIEKLLAAIQVAVGNAPLAGAPKAAGQLAPD
jgi:CheY-like chemotaxis protein